MSRAAAGVALPVLQPVAGMRTAPPRHTARPIRSLGSQLRLRAASTLQSRPTSRVAIFGRARAAPRRAHAVRVTAAAAAHTFYLHGGAVLDVYTVGPQVTLRASPPLGCADSWQMPELVLHWGVSDSPDGPWTMPSNRPHGTNEFQGSALETPFVVESPGAPNGGSHSIAVTLDNTTQYLKFVLLDRNTGYWHKDGPDFSKDFVVASGAPAEASHSNDIIDVHKRNRAAHLLWEEAGKPEGGPGFGAAADALIAKAADAGLPRDDIEWRVEDTTYGATLAERLAVPEPETTSYVAPAAPAYVEAAPAPSGGSFWGDVVAPAQQAPVHAAAIGFGAPIPLGSPPPSPRAQRRARAVPPPHNASAASAAAAPAAMYAAPAAVSYTPPPVAPSVLPIEGDVEIDVEKRNRAAHLLWEEAGCPDGPDFGPAAQELINQAAVSGLSVADIEWRVEDMSMGATLAERFGIVGGLASPAPAAAALIYTPPPAPVASVAAPAVHAAATGFGAPTPLGSPPPSPRAQRRARAVPPPHNAPGAAAVYAAPATVSYTPPPPVETYTPPPPAAPLEDVQIDVEKRNRAAHLLWEEAGCPDGPDFGPAAQDLINQAAASGLSVADIEWRVEDMSMGATLAGRFGLLSAPSASVEEFAPAPSFSASTSTASANPAVIDARQLNRPPSPMLSPRQRRRNFPQPHHNTTTAAAAPSSQPAGDTNGDFWSSSMPTPQAPAEAPPPPAYTPPPPPTPTQQPPQPISYAPPPVSFTPPPAPPAEVAPPAPATISEDLRNLAAYLLWEEAGSPAGGRYGPAALEILRAAFATGMSNQEIERRLTDTKMGGTIVDRLGVTAPLLSQQPAATTTTPGFSPPPPPASATSPVPGQGLPPRPSTPTSLRMRRRQNVPQPHNL